jgi:peptide/nickel transport system substrate-binding protein
MKDQIKDAGLDMQIQPIEFATIVSNANAGNFEASMIAWSGGSDPDDNLYSLFYSKASFNLGKYANPELDALLDSGRTTLDQATRADIYKRAQRILMQDQPFVVFLQNSRVFVARKKIQNLPVTFNGYRGVADFDRMWKLK